MLVSVDRRAEVAVPCDFAFAFVADHRRVPDWMFGISRFTPTGERTSGLGARFRAAFSGVLTFTFDLQATDWAEGELIVLESSQPPQPRARFDFESLGADRTRIRVRVDYRIPGGAAAFALRKMNDVVAGRAVRQVESNLRRQLESAFAATRRGQVS